MNTKLCIYKNCGNTSAIAQKLTFFSFPLKDVQKCELWVEMAGCEGINLKNKYLCENHFNIIYISKTPRRTILLPNAVPYRYDEKQNKDDNYDEDDYNSEKNTSREEIILEPMDDENLIYTDTIEMVHQNEDENVETIDEAFIEETLQNEKEKINSIKTMKVAQKTCDPSPGDSRNVEIRKVPDSRRVSLPDEFVNHVTKRQKLYTSSDNIIVSNTNNEKKTPTENDDTDKIAELDNTVGNPDITTFIFKGEEYIQMPKRIYLQQRVKLDADVKRYRLALQEITTRAKAALKTTD